MTCSIFSKNFTKPICLYPIIFTIFIYYFPSNVFWSAKRANHIYIFCKNNKIIMTNYSPFCQSTTFRANNNKLSNKIVFPKYLIPDIL